MEKIIVTDFNLILNKKTVLSFIEGENNEVINPYYEVIKTIAYKLILPQAVIAFGLVRNDLQSEDLKQCSEAIYVITTIGEPISNKVTELFKKGRYLEAILMNAMADSLLFQMENTLLPIIKSSCLKKGLGVKKRLEVSAELNLTTQKIIWEETNAYTLLGINITEGYMLTPMKSNTFVLGADHRFVGLNLEHNCESCKSVNCKMRKLETIDIKLHTEDTIKTIQAAKGKKMMEVFNNEDVELPFVCAGRGTCGKCAIEIIAGDSPITKADKIFFTEHELEKGCRLACQVVVESAIEMRLIAKKEENAAIVSNYKMNTLSINNTNSNNSKVYGVAIDIGTTTIAFELVNLATGENLQSYSCINKQRAFGADVISRIEASIKGKGGDLKRLIHKDIIEGLKTLCSRASIEQEAIIKTVIAANTTMIHLLMGYDCSGLGMFPFKPVNIATIEMHFINLFKSDLFECDVVIMPGVSAYIGGDITAGLLLCEFYKSKDTIMLIDIGTNGEMAIGNKENILVTSVAAGPALEGGNISWGIGSIEGAISKVTITKGEVGYKTIGDKAPIGICGSAVIDITAESLKFGFIDTTGLLKDELFDSGVVIAKTNDNIINFTQKDFREIQLAKAAIVAGIITIIKNYGCDIQDIATIYIAGGFGYHIDIDNAIAIGLIPNQFRGKIKVIGNSALGGAKQYLLDDNSVKRIESMKENTKEVYLANDPDFSGYYINSMYF